MRAILPAARKCLVANPHHFNGTLVVAELFVVVASRVELVTVTVLSTRLPFLATTGVVTRMVWVAPAARDAIVHDSIRVDALYVHPAGSDVGAPRFVLRTSLTTIPDAVIPPPAFLTGIVQLIDDPAFEYVPVFETDTSAELAANCATSGVDQVAGATNVRLAEVLPSLHEEYVYSIPPRTCGVGALTVFWLLTITRFVIVGVPDVPASDVPSTLSESRFGDVWNVRSTVFGSSSTDPVPWSPPASVTVAVRVRNDG